jgi:hypothetical protein
MMKNSMTPTEAFAFRLRHQSTINAMANAAITTIVVTALLAVVLSPILIPLCLLELLVKGVKATWFWFFPKPQPEVDETFAKVRAQFRKARRK